MNFVHSILTENYRKVFYELIGNEDDNDDDIDLSKPLRVIKFVNKPNTYYCISSTQARPEAVPFGLPHNRKWFLFQSRRSHSGFYYKKTEISSILRVLLFDLCGLSIRNIEECIKDCDSKNLPYSRDSFKNFYKRPVKVPWFDEICIHRLTVDVDGKYYKLKNTGNEFNDDMNVILAPKVEIECERNFHNVLNDRLTLYLFCRYLQELLGSEVPRIIQIPLKEVYKNIKMSFDFYKFVHKDINSLFLDVCPTIHDFLVFQDFFKHFNDIKSNEHRND